MVRRTPQEWQRIMDAHAKSNITTQEFCRQHNIHIQTFYARRHALGLATPLKRKRTSSESTKQAQVESRFVQAQVTAMPSTIVLQTHHAQVSLSTQCDPLWLAALLKGLAA